MTAVGWVWHQQGGYDLVGHGSTLPMVRFGMDLTECEGTGLDTVESQSL
jgi:hypothetical protein